MSESVADGLTKIVVELEKDEDDYPPADYENLWVTVAGNGLYRVGNIPFFAMDIALGDLVEAEPDDGLLRFRRVVQPSGHSTMRVIVYDKEEVAAVRELFKAMGCSVEQSHIPGLIALDVPPSISLAQAQQTLAEGESQERWGYEEACLAEPPPT
ncbi:MAG TPA: DUF4265 domain-containing protein [Myxococcaceae bacterium]|nr:DUF4265 domain-containing protein [Myxococcaceae bacterium]